MAKQDKNGSPLVLAAEALEAELQRFERLSETIRTSSFDSGKSLERAAKALKDVADLDDQLSAQVQGLVKAVAQVRDRQQTQAQSIHERALELQARTLVFQELLTRYDEIGKAAAALNQDVQQFAGERGEAKTEAAVVALQPKLEALMERMADLAARAEGLAGAANEKDFGDVARQADSLRQQLLSARNKLGLLGRPH